jgi:hypothetical protein
MLPSSSIHSTNGKRIWMHAGQLGYPEKLGLTERCKRSCKTPMATGLSCASFEVALFLNRGAMLCASLGCKPQEFKFKRIFSPRTDRPLRGRSVRGEKVFHSPTYLGFAPQAVTIRASGTKTRTFKTGDSG